MPNKTNVEKIFIDTDFLINFVDSKQKFHKNAHEYFLYYVNNKALIYLSTIVLAEYSVVHNIDDTYIPNVRIQNYDTFAAMKTAEFAKKLNDNNRAGFKKINEFKYIIKNDVRLISHAETLKVNYFLSGDNQLEKSHNYLKEHNLLTSEFYNIQQPPKGQIAMFSNTIVPIKKSNT